MSVDDDVIMEAIDFRYRFEVGTKVLEELDASIVEVINTGQTSIWVFFG